MRRIKDVWPVFVFLPLWLFLSLRLLLVDPPVWPDEAIYADVAMNILKENRMGSDLLSGMIPEVEKHAYWYPPVFFYLLASWLRIVGFSIVKQRLLSVGLGAVFLLVFYFLLREMLVDPRSRRRQRLGLRKSLLVYGFGFGVLVLDFVFLRGVRISRPEILILVFGGLSLLLFLKGMSAAPRAPLVRVLFAGSGLMASLAFLTHTIGGFFLISLALYMVIRERGNIKGMLRYWPFFVAFFLPVLAWVLAIAPHFEVFRDQWLMAVSRKRLEQSWVTSIFRESTMSIRAIFFFNLLVSLIYLGFSLLTPDRRHLLLSFVLFLAWLASMYGRMLWYMVFPVPFVSLAYGILASRSAAVIKKRFGFSLLVAGLLRLSFLAVVFANLGIFFGTLTAEGQRSYSGFAEEVLAAVPEGKTVFLSSIPDPYYAFVESGRGNRIHEFPVLGPDDWQTRYLSLLDAVDIVIYSGSYEQVIFGDFLNRYVTANAWRSSVVGRDAGYQVVIVELVPREQRVVP